MRRVLHYKSTYLNPSETFVDRFVRAHQRYEPIVATVSPRAFTDGLSVYAPRSPAERLLCLAAQKLNSTPPVAFRAAKEKRPDVLHAHFGPEGYRLLPLAHRTGLPLITSFHGYDISRLPDERGWAKRYARLARYGTLFLTVSNLQRAELGALGFPDERIHVLRMGLDIESVPFVARETVGRNLLLIGRMVEKKGIAYALEAVRLLTDRGRDVVLRIVGDGPLRQQVEAQVASLSLADRVELLGFVPNDVVFEHVQRSDVLLVPSVTPPDGDKEGLPQTLVEAMAAGLPVVATRHAGIPELVRHEATGLLVDERDAVGLADAIERLMGSALLVRRLSLDGREAVRRQHHLPVLVERLEALYDLAIASA
jgi:glycosyltransferase involved in cell wall biosynthesis